MHIQQGLYDLRELFRQLHGQLRMLLRHRPERLQQFVVGGHGILCPRAGRRTRGRQTDRRCT